MHSERVIVDRGLCIVLTMMTGAALFAAEACTGDSRARRAKAIETSGTASQPAEECGACDRATQLSTSLGNLGNLGHTPQPPTDVRLREGSGHLR